MSILNKIKVAVIGATGYTGLDLVLMLSKHPKVKILNLCATKNIGKKINQKALKDYLNFLAGLNVYKGNVTYKAVADTFGHKFLSPAEALNCK